MIQNPYHWVSIGGWICMSPPGRRHFPPIETKWCGFWSPRNGGFIFMPCCSLLTKKTISKPAAEQAAALAAPNGAPVIVTQSESGRTQRPRWASLARPEKHVHHKQNTLFDGIVKSSVENNYYKTCVPPKCPFNLTEDESSATDSIGFTEQKSHVRYHGANCKLFKLINYRPLCYVFYCKGSCELK